MRVKKTKNYKHKDYWDYIGQEFGLRAEREGTTALWKEYRRDNINTPPLDEISDFFSRGYVIFQISQNVWLGVIIFSIVLPF